MGKRSKPSHLRSRKKRKKKEKEVGESSNQNQVRVSDDSAEGYKYEVFLSFFGKDTRKKFTDHLYNYLEDLRIDTFRDDEELDVGKKIWSELQMAIETSKIMMPIFSKNYASSEWCLREVTHMVKWVEMHQDTTVMCPIFYDVTPSEVKKQTGSFQKAFDEHKNQFDKKTVKEWRKALRKVPETKGWERDKIANGHEGKLVEKVVTRVLMELKKRHVEVTEHLVGMDQHEEVLMSLLDLDCKDVKIIWIVGMGGIGKTTIAKFIYNKLCDRFSQRCSFLENVREKEKQSEGLDRLKNKLKFDILKRTSDEVEMNQNTFKSTKALIVLDDVHDRNFFLMKTIGKCDFGDGSRIIVTTRNRDNLREQDGEKIYEPGVMHYDNALSLFCKHAFRQDCPREGYEDLSKKIVLKVAGLPLSLEVIGSLLSTKPRRVWDDKLKMLAEEIMDGQIQKCLKISYDMLDDRHKKNFLDVACHFSESKKHEAAVAPYMWEDCGFYPNYGIDALITLSLVKIDEHGGFKMHDQLRDLGRTIVKEKNPKNAGRRSRLWSPEEALEVLARKNGTRLVKTLSLCDLRISRLSNKAFEGLSGLRYLDLYRASNLRGNFKGIFSNLRWFRWKLASQITEITNFFLPKLVVLDLSESYLSDGWEDLMQIKRATNLKVLDLSHCHNLTKIPDLSSFSKLERLNLEGCHFLAEISPSIGNLQHLIYLNLNECYYREKVLDNTSFFSQLKLPEFVWKLKSLVELHMKSLYVTELSDAIGNLTNLSILDVGCTGIKKFPNTIGALTNLERLDASNCKSLEELPESVGNLRSLRWLRISYSEVKRLPSAMGRLKKLEELDASNCKSLEGLPKTIGDLQNLRRLTINGSKVIRLPSAMGRLKKLEELDASNCKSLKELPITIGKLQSLRRLTIFFSGVKRLPSEIGTLEKLEELDSSRCKSLQELPETTLPSLRRLNISFSGVKRCKFGRLEKLEELDASLCYILKELPQSVGNLQNLRRLNICNSPVKRLPSEIGKLEKLEELDASACISLEEFPETMGNLRSLRRLNIRNSGVKRLPSEIEKLEKLEELDANGCKLLEELPKTMGNLRSLRRLCISESRVKRLPNEIGRLEKLEELDANYCQSLGELPDSIGKLSHLRVLHIANSRVKRCEIGRLEKLEELDASYCEALEELTENIGNLTNLQQLFLGTTAIKKLPAGIGKLQNLEMLNCGWNSLEGESSLEGELPNGIWSLPKLRELILRNTRISSLVPADMSCGRNLRVLDLGSCPNIRLPSSELKLPPDLERLGIPLTKESLDSLARLPYLEEIAFHQCDRTNLVEFPVDLGGLPNKYLYYLRFYGNFASLPVKINNLPRLRALSFGDGEFDHEYFDQVPLLVLNCCRFLERLPDMPNTLEGITIHNCPKLTDVDGLAGLTSLIYLHIESCPSLDSLPDLSTLNDLFYLRINGCEKLRRIRGLDAPTDLKYLWLIDCPSLEKLPLSKLWLWEGALENCGPDNKFDDESASESLGTDEKSHDEFNLES